jgi:hypothetical protein
MTKSEGVLGGERTPTCDPANTPKRSTGYPGHRRSSMATDPMGARGRGWQISHAFPQNAARLLRPVAPCGESAAL